MVGGVLDCFVVFFKQKTAYDMCISDWSSDVCSSDLPNRKLSRELSVLNAVFQLRANDIIREKEALAYSPQVGITSSADYRGYGTLTASAAAAPEKLPALYDAIDGLVADLRDQPNGADKPHRAREPLAHRSRHVRTSAAEGKRG